MLSLLHPSFRIHSTDVTPYVEFRNKTGFMKVEGKSSPHSSLEFYHPIIMHLREFKPEKPTFTAVFKMDYFNTSSSKCLYDLFRELARHERAGTHVDIQWHYHRWDQDMLETGEDFEDAVGLHFHFVEMAD